MTIHYQKSGQPWRTPVCNLVAKTHTGLRITRFKVTNAKHNVTCKRCKRVIAAAN